MELALAFVTLRAALAVPTTVLAWRARQGALWSWAALWWASLLVPPRLASDPRSLLAAAFLLLAVAVTWRAVLRCSRWGRTLAVAGAVLLCGAALAPVVAIVPVPGALVGRLAAEILVGAGVLLAAFDAAWDRARLAEQRLAENERHYRRMVNWDPLTECATRPVFRDFVDRVRAGGGEQRGTILVIDMDGLKRINDHAGHSAGDKAIRRTGLAIKGRLRDGDLALRWGGDEFVVVLAGADVQTARQTRRRVAAAVRREGLSVSIGLSPYGPDNDVVQALREADARMYAMKRRRRRARLPMPRQLSLPLDGGLPSEAGHDTLPPAPAPSRV